MILKVRCPVCGTIVLEKQVNGNFEIQVFELHGLGKGRGFSFDLTRDDYLVSLVKQKILRLYYILFGHPTVGVDFFPSVGAKLGPCVGVIVKPMGVSAYVRKA